MVTNWHLDFLELAEYWSKKRSKDPSLKVGAVITRPDNTICSLAYNGFPIGTPDLNYDDREYKNDRVIHAEMNALLFAKESVQGYTIYCSAFPCCRCAAHIIQAGIKRVVSRPIDESRIQRSKYDVSLDLFREAGVEVIFLEEQCYLTPNL